MCVMVAGIFIDLVSRGIELKMGGMNEIILKVITYGIVFCFIMINQLA